MAISVTSTYQGMRQLQDGPFLRRAELSVTGLAAGANTLPHGLPAAPQRVTYRPGAAGGWGETSAPDAANLYVTVGTGGATAGTIDVEY